jgi:glycosyltransferase involved in cell wall biosynthesis
MISGLVKNDCSGCGATILERQLKLYFDEFRLLQGRSSMRILHFNPEPRFLGYLANFKPEIHILAMSEAVDRRYEIVDIEDMPYGDGVFDMVIANGHLDRVSSLEKSLNEINRVLKSNGIALLQTRFSHVLETTWEDTGLDSEGLRKEAFGNGSYRRLFARDIINRLSQTLCNSVFHYSQIAVSGNPHALDINEPFMLFRKKLTTEPRSLLSAPHILNDPVMVSIVCITYNHAAFIAQTVSSFVEQKTNFRFEVVIGEDCSTDDTLNILSAWVERYPDVIKLLKGGANLGASKNWMRAYKSCSGRYIAMCEGDDRWTDPLKLQKQFDYMEAHPNCALTFGNVQAHKENCINYNYIGGAKLDISAEILQHAPPINTLTVMFRNVLEEIPPEFYACGAGDMFIWSLLGQVGYGHYMPEILPSIYNLHGGGLHSLTGPANQHLLRLKTFYAAFHYYSRIDRHLLAEYFLQNVAKDAEYIAQICTPEETNNLLGNLVSEMSRIMSDIQPFDISALSAIIERVLAKLEISNAH